MGQGQSRSTNQLQVRIEHPPAGHPTKGLAFIAHGRLGGNYDQPQIRCLADYLRNQKLCRVVTWNERDAEWWDAGAWVGDAAIQDYKSLLREQICQFSEDFPSIRDAELYICGYSAGALFAACSRPPPSAPPHFAAPRYILISYPVEATPALGLWNAGSYFRALEALVQGHGWEGLPSEFEGKEPDVGGVLTIAAQHDTHFMYFAWAQILGSKNARGTWKQVIVEGTGHDWKGMTHRIVEEVDKWLS